MDPSGTLINLFKEQLENESAEMANEFDLQKRGDLLTWWYFIRIHDMDPEQIAEIVCDGGNDLGIDAVWIDEESFVHFYQFKNPERIDGIFPEGEIDKVISGLTIILAQRHESIANEELKGRIEEIYQSVRNGYRLHLVTSGSGVPETATTKLNSFVTQLGGPTEEFFVWDLQDISRLQDIFYQKTLPTVEAPIEFELTQAPYPVRSANHDCYFFHATGKILSEIYGDHGEQLLQQNIRVFQGDRATNASILQTCTGPMAASFLHFNNGVTFLAESAQWDAFTHKLTMGKAQVVNGGQTIRVLHNAHSSGQLQDGVLIPVRLITSQGDKEFANNVAVNLNNQNRIQPSFLRSNDPRVIQLGSSHASLGWYLERREKQVQFLTNDERKEIETRIGHSIEGRVIKIKEGTQAYVSTFMGQPEMAKKNPRLMFLGSQDGGYFDRIFNAEMTAEKFLAAQSLFWEVSNFVKQFMKRKRRKERVCDWKKDYTELIGDPLFLNHGEVVDQVIPQSAIFLTAIIYQIEVITLGRSIDEVVSELIGGDYSLLTNCLDQLISFAEDDQDSSKSWPTLLKSQSFYENFVSFLRGRISTAK